MKVVGKSRATKIMDWLSSKKFKYSVNMMKTNPFYGVYYLDIENADEEMITKLTWGIT